MNIKQLKQDKADLAAKLAALKAEGWKLGAVPAATRTPEQIAALAKVDTDIAETMAAQALNESELARAERYANDERAQATPNIEAGQDRAEQRPWGPKVSATAPALVQKEARHIALGNFCQAVRVAALGGVADVRLMAAATGAGTQVDSAEGFAVPRDVAPGIEREMFELGDILQRVDARSITGNNMTYNVFDETSRADGSRGGGVLGYWVDEGVAPTASNTKRAKIEMKLRKVGTFGVMTDELLSDGMAMGGELEEAFSYELTFQVENKIYRGNGSSAPQGFLNASCLVSVAKESGQSAATILGTNITKMWARMPARSQKNAVWLANVDTIPQLAELNQPIGTGGVRYPYITFENGTFSLWGRPVIFVEYAESLGTVGDLALVDLARYRLIRKGGVEQASSMHVYFSTGEQAFRAFYRVDGQAVPRAAMTPFKGSLTLSPFVVLATRA